MTWRKWFTVQGISKKCGSHFVCLDYLTHTHTAEGPGLGDNIH